MGKEKEKDDRPWYEKSGLWKKPEGGSTDETAETEAVSAGSSGQKPHVNIAPTVTSQGVAKPEWEKYFAEVREKANLPGPDYKELAETYNDYKADISDEGQRMKMAFKGFQKMGMTKPKLIEDANYYRKLFGEKKVAFDDAINLKITNEIGSMQTEADGLKQKNIDIDKQIQDLTQQKIKNDARAVELSNKISEKSSALNTQKADFEVTYNNIIGEIDHHLELINQHIQ